MTIVKEIFTAKVTTLEKRWTGQRLVEKGEIFMDSYCYDGKYDPRWAEVERIGEKPSSFIPKKLTRKEAEALNRDQLREFARQFGVTGRSTDEIMSQLEDLGHFEPKSETPQKPEYQEYQETGTFAGE